MIHCVEIAKNCEYNKLSWRDRRRWMLWVKYGEKFDKPYPGDLMQEKLKREAKEREKTKREMDSSTGD